VKPVEPLSMPREVQHAIFSPMFVFLLLPLHPIFLFLLHHILHIYFTLKKNVFILIVVFSITTISKLDDSNGGGSIIL
jgi:hypothetical protein